MNNYPEYIEINNKKYKINTDFRIALECDDIARSEEIGDYEKCLAIIYKLFGEEALNEHSEHDKIFKLAIKYLQCGKESEKVNDEKEPSLDFEQDIGYIRASFMSDYQIDINSKKMHWWAFNDLMAGFTENAIINRVRYIREEPLTDKKGKEREKWIEAKRQVALTHKKTLREKELDRLWEKQMKRGDDLSMDGL